MAAVNLNFKVEANSNTEAVCLALGWMYTEVCTQLDEGKDPRKIQAPEYIEGCLLDLQLDQQKRQNALEM